MGYAQHRCVMHAQAEQAALWYYRDTADGLEYPCADGHARLPSSISSPGSYCPTTSIEALAIRR
jgi:hypothetical protein